MGRGASWPAADLAKAFTILVRHGIMEPFGPTSFSGARTSDSIIRVICSNSGHISSQVPLKSIASLSFFGISGSSTRPARIRVARTLLR